MAQQIEDIKTQAAQHIEVHTEKAEAKVSGKVEKFKTKAGLDNLDNRCMMYLIV